MSAHACELGRARLQNSIPPTTTAEALQLEVAQAEREGCFIDVGFWGGVVPSSMGELSTLLADERILGVKAFLSPLPAAAGYEALSPEQLNAAARILTARTAPVVVGDHSLPPLSLPLLVHCELFTNAETEALSRSVLAPSEHRSATATRRSFAAFASTRPPSFERRAIEALLKVVAQHPQLAAHIVHLSDAGSLPMITEARRTGGYADGRLSIETCPHYLRFVAESIPDGETRLKCLPPIRDGPNRERLWDGLASGAIDMIASDHSPCLPEMRALESGDFFLAWAGISGLQFSLPATWSEAHSPTRNHTISDLAMWWSERPAKLCGQLHRKGSLRVGKDADLVVWRPEELALTDTAYHRHPGSPYAGDPQLRGRIERTYLRGREVFRRDAAAGGRVHEEERGCGRTLRRRPAQ